jgi:hypothetical protein
MRVPPNRGSFRYRCVDGQVGQRAGVGPPCALMDSQGLRRRRRGAAHAQGDLHDDQHQPGQDETQEPEPGFLSSDTAFLLSAIEGQSHWLRLNMRCRITQAARMTAMTMG